MFNISGPWTKEMICAISLWKHIFSAKQNICVIYPTISKSLTKAVSKSLWTNCHLEEACAVGPQQTLFQAANCDNWICRILTLEPFPSGSFPHAVFFIDFC